MPKCIHGLFFYKGLIEKDEKGYYRIWVCGKCGKEFKIRNLDTNLRDITIYLEEQKWINYIVLFAAFPQ